MPGKSLPAPITLPISFRYHQRDKMGGWIKGERDKERETGEKKEENRENGTKMRSKRCGKMTFTYTVVRCNLTYLGG